MGMTLEEFESLSGSLKDTLRYSGMSIKEATEGVQAFSKALAKIDREIIDNMYGNGNKESSE